MSVFPVSYSNPRGLTFEIFQSPDKLSMLPTYNPVFRKPKQEVLKFKPSLGDRETLSQKKTNKSQQNAECEGDICNPSIWEVKEG